jgi:Flp pilus assembly protein CpaB
MSTNRNLLLPGVLAALAAALTLVYVAHAAGTAKTARQSYTTAYVVTRDIAAGTPGAEVARLVKLVRLPASAIVPEAVRSPLELAGRIAVDPIYRGQQLTIRSFGGLQQQGVLAHLSGRMRVIQIAGDANQLLAGTLQPGERVDVVASLKTSDKQLPYGITVLRGLLVLRAPSASSGGQVGGAQSTYAATLSLTDAQAQTLFFVTKNGDWSLVLRPVVGSADGTAFVDSIQSVLGGGR